MEFRRPSYFALAALIDGPLHGYAIVRRASVLSDGSVRLSTGTLYALLERAIADGLVVAGNPYTDGGRTRRDYTLTPFGRSELEAEARRLSSEGRTVARRLRATAAVVAPRDASTLSGLCCVRSPLRCALLRARRCSVRPST
jgi:PadR family transcriptional regulator PadR